MRNSLLTRSVMVTAAVLIALLSFTGLSVSQRFQNAQISAHQERIKAQSYSLLANAEFRNGSIQLPEYVADSRFNEPSSGSYAFVTSEALSTIWQSASVENLPMMATHIVPAGTWQYSRASYLGKRYEIARYGFIWGDNSVLYNLVFIEDSRFLNDGINQFRRNLLLALLTTFFMMMLLQYTILRWGFMPLRRISADLDDLHTGKTEQLPTSYPTELQPLISDLNHLIRSERGHRERYRNTLSDLSHSLKTPLAVVNNLISQDKITESEQETIQAQVSKMTDSIRYHLERAVSGSGNGSIARVNVSETVQSVVGAMNKVYADKQPEINIKIAENAVFTGDKNDLLELVANLVDNACKYCKGYVSISACMINQSAGSEILEVRIEDDGPGIPDHQQSDILKRGVRLDSQTPGQGIGLAVVKDILESYGANLSIYSAGSGGAGFCLEFSGKK